MAVTAAYDILDYLEESPDHKETLIFESSEEASAAAHTLRSRCDPVLVEVTASYDKVFIKLRGAK